MLDASPFVVPPAPAVHPKDLSSLGLLLTMTRNSLAIWPDYAFDAPFSRNRLFGIESVLINDPAGIRHVMTTNAANYVRPAMMPRIMRPLIGRGLFLAEGGDWRRQRRLLSPAFTPANVNILIPHFLAAANDLVRDLEGRPSADLSDAYQVAALNAALRALFSMPDQRERDRIGALVRQYVAGPGRPQFFDGFAKSETSFAFALGGRRAFQTRWFAAVDEIVAARRNSLHHEDTRDLLDLLITARDPDGGLLAADEVRDQCATMIFGGYETTARLLFWATYLLTLDRAEQARLRAEVAAFPPERVTSLDDLGNWPRLRLVLLETLRLYPPIPLLVREPIEDDVVMGEQVRRGVAILYCALGASSPSQAPETSDRLHSRSVCEPGVALDRGRRLSALRRRSAHMHRRRLRSGRGADHAGDRVAALRARHRGRASRHAGGAADHPAKLSADIQARTNAAMPRPAWSLKARRLTSGPVRFAPGANGGERVLDVLFRRRILKGINDLAVGRDHIRNAVGEDRAVRSGFYAQ